MAQAFDTGRLELRPGELANMAAVRNAIEHGQRAYDFLRGDEEYKSRWRAEPSADTMMPAEGDAMLF